MKYLLFIFTIFGLLATNTLSLKALNYLETRNQDNFPKTDSSLTNNVGSSEYNDDYLTLISQPELISETENDVIKLN